MLAIVVRRDPSTDEVEGTTRNTRLWRRLAVATGLPLAAVLVVLWVERRPIAIHYIDRMFAAHGVSARYRLVDLGPGRQRLTDVVIGDPAHPDLVADWIETETGVGLDGIALTGVRAGRVRVRARLVDGRLSLGSIDRLLPASSGKPGGLPAWRVELGDARVRLETTAGVVGIGLTGRGRLDDGFAGRAALVAPALIVSGCAAAAPRATLAVTTRRGVVRLAGPVTAATAACGATRLSEPRLTLDLGVDPRSAGVNGKVRLAGGPLVDPRLRVGLIAGVGTVSVAAGRASGRVSIDAATAATAYGAARALFAHGNYALGADSGFDGSVGAEVVTLDRRLLDPLARVTAASDGTPVGPLVRNATSALTSAAGRLDVSATIVAAHRLGKTRLTARHVDVTSSTGDVATFRGSAALAGPIDGRLAIQLGGWPPIDVTLRRRADRAPISGTMTAVRYAAGGASLATGPTRFTIVPGGEVRLATVATLGGPLGDGRVDGLVVPLSLRRDAAGAWWVDEACVPASVARLATGGLRLDRVRLALCPVDGALVRVAANGTVGGGIHLGPTRLDGMLGRSPVAIEAGDATLAIAKRGFNATHVTAALGAVDHKTHLVATTLTGTIMDGGVAGSFAGGGGQIGAVPLRLSEAAGRWRLAGGVLDLDGELTVADAAAPPVCGDAADPALRFCPMRARDVTMRLADNRITAGGVLTEPTTGGRVAKVAIVHDLTGGSGHADLTIDKLAFAKGFQPVLLTPVTKGVIADVAGTIDGTGRIDWSDAGVTSTGRFTTAGTDLAAAFGTVTGIAGSIAFTDLLGLVSAPGQQVTVASINAGVLVENGTVRFHTEPGVKVAVEDAHWPFAAGTLTLEPTLLDFSAPAERHMTFRLDGIAADRFLEQFDFKNLAATGTFDGVLPMVFDARGGRIEGGHLTVREGGGGLAYVGDLSQKELGFWGNLAFQALKSLRYRNLSILMNGPLDGEIVTAVRFAGVSQGQGAKSNILIRRLQRLPFVFNVTIRAPFRTLLDGLDPARQAQQHLRELIDDAKRADGATAPVQPSASAPVR